MGVGRMLCMIGSGCVVFLALTACSGGDDSDACDDPPCSDGTDVDDGTDPDPGTDAPEECEEDEFECDGECSTLVDDVDNCGSCGNECASVDGGTVTCENAECVTECAADTRLCDDECAPCPTEGVTRTVCSTIVEATCNARDCDDGYIRCDDICEPNPENATNFECSGANGVTVYDCEDNYSLIDNMCVFPDVVSMGASTSQTFTMGQFANTDPELFCSSNVAYSGFAAVVHCEPGLWSYRFESTAPDALRSMGVFVFDEMDPGERLASTCWDRFDYTEEGSLRRLRELGVGECSYIQVDDTGVNPGATLLHVDGPFEVVDDVTLSLGADLSITIPTGLAFATLEISRSAGSVNTPASLTVEEVLPTGEVVSTSVSFSAGTTVRRPNIGWVYSDSTLRIVQGSSPVVIDEVRASFARSLTAGAR